MSPTPSTTSAPLPSWFGFVMGLFGGFAVSMGFVGLVIGMTMGGGLQLNNGGMAAQVAQNLPPAPTPPAAPEPAPSAPVQPVDPATDHIRGNPNAKVTVIEYSDFECPFCKRHHPTMVQLLETYGDDVNWVYRHFPLSFHPRAEPAAEASECVAELAGNDGFWKFADAIIEGDLSDESLLAQAKAAGADEAKYKECMASGKYKQKVADQMNSGVAAGVQGTPGNIVVLNATKEQRDISGAVPLSNFQTVIDSLLGK